MKKILLTMGMIMLAAASAVASPLQPKSCSLGEPGSDYKAPFLAPLSEIGVNFNMPVEVAPSVTATVYCGDEKVCESTSVTFVYNYGETEGCISLNFDDILLPKGKSYRLELPAGAVHSLLNPDIVSDEVTVNFLVPKYIEERTDSNIPDGSRLTALYSYSYYWYFETKAAIENPVCMLYRGDELIGSYPGTVTWDWILGQAHFDFGKDIYFDNDVEYSIVIPEGTVCGLYRDDIVNRECVFRFIGSHIPEEPGVHFRRVGFRWDDATHDLIGIDYTFADPITLGADPHVLIWQEGVDTPVYDALPYINDMVNCFMLSADFDDMVWESGPAYEIELTEGSVYSQDGIPNKRISTKPEVAGVPSIGSDPEEAPLYDLTGRRIVNPQHGRVYIQSGRKIIFRE